MFGAAFVDGQVDDEVLVAGVLEFKLLTGRKGS